MNELRESSENPMNTTRSTRERDIAHVLHGYTNLKSHEQKGPMVIESGEGIYVTDSAGRRYIEAMAGLWNVSLGFSEPRLADAAARQPRRVPFFHNFSPQTHTPCSC